MSKTITIGAIDFELCGTTERMAVRQRSLYECYSNPSETKRSIWYEWVSWFQEMKCFEYGVSSYNCMFFSIEAIVTVETGESYLLWITRSHNRAYLIK